MPNRSLRAVCRRRYWREDDARLVLGALERSGETMAAFARRHGVKVRRLEYWRDRVAGEDVAGLELLPVTVTPSLSSSSVVSVTVGNARVDVAEPSQVEPTWLAALVREVSESMR